MAKRPAKSRGNDRGDRHERNDRGSSGASGSGGSGSDNNKSGGSWSAREYLKERFKKTSRLGSPRRPEPVVTAPDPLLKALADMPGGATASQLATALNRGDHSRDVGAALRRLVEQGLVMEGRPGRYQISGTNGEYAVLLESAPAGGTGGAGGAEIVAKFPDGRLLPVNPRYTIGASAGDVAQAMIGEDNLVLITRILRRSGRDVLGTVNFKPGGPVLVCDNRREGELKVLSTFSTFDATYQAGDRVVGTVEVDAQGNAGVHLKRILGKETPEVADFRYVCLVHDLPGEFPAEVVAQAAAYPDAFPLNKREDLRDKLVFTIDPATAKDFDDAISLERDDQGRWVLGVHIADVSHYVTEHTPLDAEAAQRATSIYLINRVIPMLPENLSNGLCSLVPNRDRYCLSAFLTLDKNYKLVHTRLAESLINSRHRFTYEEALAVLEAREEPGRWPDDVRTILKETNTIAQGLRKAREKAGALNLFSVEHRFSLDVEGVPTEVGRESTDISHQLIEECMLLANRAVAQWLIDQKLPCVFRVHEQPDEERMQVFATLLETYGLDSSRIQNRFGLQKMLGDLAKEPPAARLVLNFLCLRSFKKAIYSVDNIGHYALAFEAYAHFTSPIRRYPDLLVHRLVKRGLNLPGYRNVELRRNYLDALARQSSNLEQRAESAERDLHARKAARYLSARMGQVFAGVVTTATPGGLSIQLMETGMDGFVPMREFKDDFYEYDAERYALVGRRSGRVVGIGTEMDVQVVSVDIERADVVLGFAEPGASTVRTDGRTDTRVDRGGQIAVDRSRTQRRGDTKNDNTGSFKKDRKPDRRDERKKKRRR